MTTIDIRSIIQTSLPTGAQGPAGPTGPSTWVTSGSAIYYTAGSVGIGTASPTGALHVVGDAIVTGKITQNGIDTRSFAMAMSVALSI